MLQHKRIFLFIFIAFCAVINTAFGQFPQFYFETYTTSDGLSSNNITCLYQDTKGFLWVGTDYGLNRFDGIFFTTFYADNSNPNSLSGNYIVEIIQDRDEIFWIATLDGGLTRYDPRQTRDKQFT
ncbi:MAG: two-component regulator propeller domain-containing protein, partial [Chitinophagales bacterium]